MALRYLDSTFGKRPLKVLGEGLAICDQVFSRAGLDLLVADVAGDGQALFIRVDNMPVETVVELIAGADACLGGNFELGLAQSLPPRLRLAIAPAAPASLAPAAPASLDATLLQILMVCPVTIYPTTAAGRIWWKVFATVETEVERFLDLAPDRVRGRKALVPLIMESFDLHHALNQLQLSIEVAQRPAQ